VTITPRHLRIAAAVAVAGLVAAAGGAASASPAAVTPAAASTAGSRVIAVGDIASSGGAQARTAAIVAKRSPQQLVALGDLAYNAGSKSNFTNYYQPTYGKLFKPITWPLPGNHEYLTSGASGFKSYFGITGVTWWKHRIGAWTVIGLDSEKPTSSTQLAFLKAALKNDNGRPTIVAWHRPRFSTGQHGNASDMQTLWATAAVDRDVRIMLWGHDHDYERMSIPITSTHAVQAFVVGTGGAELRPFAKARTSRTVARISGAYGVLDLRLRSTGWSWFFVKTDGTVADSGSRAL